MLSIREQLQIFVRRFGLLNAACCDVCCGEEVSLVQSHILFEVRHSKMPSMQQVADELGLDLATFSRQVSNLEEKGFLERHRSKTDRRVCLLKITASGELIMRKADSYMEGKINQIFEVMSPFEREVVSHSFILFNDAMNRIRNK